MENVIGISEKELKKLFLELVRRTSTILPEDVVDAIKMRRDSEKEGSRARNTLGSILQNIQMADDGSRPICQDTGTVTFYVYYPFGMRQSDIEKQAKEAVREATEHHYLRPNVVDPLTGMSKFDNIGRGHPSMNFEQWDEDYLKVTLVMKGGGSENVGAQYSLPYGPLGAGRDMNGIKKVVIDAVLKAQGKGCAPGMLGIGIGGDRATSYLMSKKQLHRKMTDTNDDPELSKLEEWVLENGNSLGIGPMGFGGKTTLLGVKAGVVDRLPASYFVAITYMCWAYRRRTLTVRSGEVEYD